MAGQCITRARSFFFTLANPGIETGGFFGESKSEILKHIPDEFKPRTVLFKAPFIQDQIEDRFHSTGLSFPVIIKPEIGERGWLIRRINTISELKNYLTAHQIDFLIQTYVDLPTEVSIMMYSLPDGSESAVTSICEKYFLQIHGDGHSTIGQLILNQDRALLQLEKLLDKFGHRWDEQLPAGEKLVLEHVGNHCRGTTFLNRNEWIDGKVHEIMLPILRSMPEVYYGRFDLRIGSLDLLKEGKAIQILEFNGASSDPAHIYHPGYSLWKAYRDMAFHWKIMRRIARQNRERGLHKTRIKKIIAALILYFRYKRTN